MSSENGERRSLLWDDSDETELGGISPDTVVESASKAGPEKAPGEPLPKMPEEVDCETRNPRPNQDLQPTSRIPSTKVELSYPEKERKRAELAQKLARQTIDRLGRIDPARAEQAQPERERAETAFTQDMEPFHRNQMMLLKLVQRCTAQELEEMRPLAFPKWTLLQGPGVALSLDAGGRGRTMVQLEILATLMDKHSKDLGLDTILKPSDVFHLIVGSGTGALVAVLLGRLRMTVEEVIEFYQDFEKAVFDTPAKLNDPMDERHDLLATTSAGAARGRKLAARLTEFVEGRKMGTRLLEALDPGMGAVLITAHQQCSGKQDIRSLRSQHYG